MASSDVLPAQNGTLESFDSSEFSLISEPPHEEAGLHYSGTSTVLQTDLMSAQFDLSEEEIQKRLYELAEDNRCLRESLQTSSTVMKSELKAIAAWHNDITTTTAELKVSLQEAQKKVKDLEKEKEELLEKLAKKLEDGPQKVENTLNSDEDSEYEIVQKKSKDTESLRSQLKDADYNIAMLMQKNQEQNLKIGTMKKLHDEIEKENNELKAKLVDQEELNSKLADLQKQVALTEEKNATLNSKIKELEDTVLSQKVASAISMNDELLLNQAEEYQTKTNSLKAEHEKSLARLEAQIKDLKSKLAAETLAAETARKKNLEDKKILSVLQANYDRVSKQLQMLSRKEKNLTDSMDNERLVESKKNLEQIDCLTARIFDYEQRLEESKARVMSLTKDLELAKEESEQPTVLKAQLEVLKVDLESAMQEKEAALREAQELKDSQSQAAASFCSNCGAGSVHGDFSSKGARGKRRHNKSSESLPRAGPELYICPICQFGFTELQALENHVNTCIDKAQ